MEKPDLNGCVLGVVILDPNGLLKLVVPSTLDGKTELEPIVDRDLDAFSKFYSEKLRDRLSKFEMAAIKTYLYWKTPPEIQ